MFKSACGEWVIIEKTEQKSVTGIISSDGNFGKVLDVGEECPESIQKLKSKTVWYTESRTAQEINDYIALHWADIFYVEEWKSYV
jgi:hypothetical protein